MIPTADHVDLLDRCRFEPEEARAERAAATLPLADLRGLVADREREREELEWLIARDR